MGIQEKLDYLEDTKQAIKQAIIDKGITVADTDTFRSYAKKVGEISGGGGCSLYGVTVADLLGKVDENGKLNNGADELNFVFDGVEDLGNNVLKTKFQYKTNIKSVSFPDLVQISGEYSCENMLYGCTSILTADLSNLENITGYNACNRMFYGCTNLTNVNIDNLQTVTKYGGASNMFAGCSSLVSISLSKLKSLTAQISSSEMFLNCTNLTNVDLSDLSNITGKYACSKMFKGCISISTLSFPALTSNSFGTITNQFNNMLSGVTGCTVHFPSNLESVIGTWSDVVAGFGGTNTVVLFDLPATE